MNPMLSQMKSHYWQGDKAEALACADKLLSGLDADDDDDAELLLEAIRCGFFECGDPAIIQLVRQKGLKFPVEGLALQCVEAHCNDPAILAAVVELGADPYLANPDGRNILHLLANRKASGSGKSNPLGEYAAQAFDLDRLFCTDGYGATPLHYAVLTESAGLIKAMLEKGADPNATGSTPSGNFSHVLSFDGMTALALACQHGMKEIAFLLLDGGADDALRDNGGRSPAFCAVMEPCKHFCPGYFSSIPSQQAVVERKTEILRRLEQVDLADEQGRTPLLYAVSLRDYSIGNLALPLIEKGADVEASDKNGFTPLMYAALNAHQEVLKALVGAGVQLDRQNREGNTALHLALEEYKTKQARFLVKKGAGFQIPNNKGETAADIAARRGQTEVLELMMAD